ncbi:LysR family transcriptional regulator [Paraburkholderia pallida]|uniref:LysR family transcriptional regulator n=1 Tax=Paraburkholderia pallida TaxID=2547399 RepID=A0A4P7D6F0_9BURK|nr:LysR family transcriptional regulator [Paraburkholderia pallida]QBR02560.1 LysR family transcriptional regulator [Paraburkholderia pallida]
MNPVDLLNLAHLHAFRLVAETGSATRAAASLYRAQSAVTRSVQELETALGEPLFERRASGMLPTAAGRVALDRCARIFIELETLAQWCKSRQTHRRALPEGTLPPWLLNTRRLQLFVALARHRHMPSTAGAFGISQPAVSSAMRVLESGSGITLFHRSPLGLQLTPEGEIFLLHVRRALNELRHVPDDIAALHGSIQGTATVGALPLGRTLMLPGAIARMSALHPGVRVVTDESAYDVLVARLHAGDIDFMLGALREDDAASGLANERLVAEDMVVLARSGHPLVRQKGMSLSDLRDAQWIAPRMHSPAHALFEAQFRRLKLKPPMPSVETADLAVIRGVLMGTDMVAAVCAQQLHYEIASGQLAVLDVPLSSTRREIGLTLRADSAPSPAARALIDAIRLAATDAQPSTRGAEGRIGKLAAR